MMLVLLAITGVIFILESAMTLSAVKVLDHLINVLLLASLLRCQAILSQSS